jgi:hypothetical protein
MIPNVFISSTIEDLHYLRDAIRDVVSELAYNPVMSEYGDVGYSPVQSAEGSCYVSLRQCQLAVLIIGKRYGSLSKNSLSVTHNEFRAARENRIPIITLIDSEVMAFKKVFDTNKPEGELSAPGMDSPSKTFELIAEIVGYTVNNGILTYSNVADARRHLKRQLAHLFGEFLSSQFDPIKADVKDVLSEIKTLRHELEGQRDIASDGRFLKAVRFLVDENREAKEYRELLENRFALGQPFDAAVRVLLESPTFDDVVRGITGADAEIVEFDPPPRNFEEAAKAADGLSSKKSSKAKIWKLSVVDVNAPPEAWRLAVIGRVGKRLLLNGVALDFFRDVHSKLRNSLP